MAKNLFLCLLIILGIVVPWHWFADGRIIAGGDHLFYYRPIAAFYENWFTWINRINFGEPNYAVAFLFPFLSFFKILSLLGFSPVASEILWAIFLFLLPGIFMFLLVKEFLPEKSSWCQGGAFVAALFYMFNPYIMTDMLQISQRPVHIVLPLLLLLWHKGLTGKSNNLKYSLLFSLSTLLTASTGTAPAFLAIIPLLIFLYTVFYLLFRPSSWRPTLFFILKTLFLSLLINLWWIIPASLAYLQSGEAIQKTVRAGDFTGSTSLWEALRLMGFWAFRNDWDATTAHIPYAHFYYEPFFLFISYALTALGVVGLLLKGNRRIQFFFAVLFLLGVFLSKGGTAPLGSIYRYLFDHLPLFSMFREPFSKFTSLSLFSLAALLGLSWGKIAFRFRERLRCFITLSLAAVVLIYSFPIVTGQVIQDPSWHKMTRDSLHVEIPVAWYEVGRWFEKNDPLGRILLLPKSSYGVCFNWTMGTCAGQPLARLFVPNQTIRFPPVTESPRDGIIQSLYETVTNNDRISPSSLLSFLGIRYVLQQNDLDWRHSPRETFSPEESAALLARDNGLKKEASFSQLDVYGVQNKAVYPLFYATNNLSWVDGETTDFGKLISLEAPSFPQSYYFSGGGNQSSNELLERIKVQALEKIVFPKENETAVSNNLTVTFPEDGVYHGYLAFQGDLTGVAQVKVGEEDLVLESGVVGKVGWLSLGERYFQVGRYSVTISYDTPPNLIAENYFGAWYPGPSGVSLTDTRYYTTSSLKPLPPGRYILSFTYDLPPEVRVTFSLKEKRCAAPTVCDNSDVFSEVLPTGRSVLPFQKEFVIYPPAKDTVLQLEVAASHSADVPSLWLREERLTPIYEGNLVFIKKGSGSVKFRENLPEVTFRRLNPARAEIFIKKVTAPYYLVFSESFNANWQLKIGGKILPKDRHFVINGFANGWLLYPEDASGLTSYLLTLEYSYQRYFFIGLVISLLSIFFSVLCLLRRKIRFGFFRTRKIASVS